jgi:hypothetical protein
VLYLTVQLYSAKDDYSPTTAKLTVAVTSG